MESEPQRVAKILAQAEARRQRRGIKERVFRPRRDATFSDGPKPVEYRRLKSGQITGHPQTMRTVKQEARRTRLQRRANFRIEKRFTAITKAVLSATY